LRKIIPAQVCRILGGKKLKGIGPAELHTLGITPAQITFEGHTLLGIEINMSEGTYCAALAAAYTGGDINADIPLYRVFAYCSGRAYITARRLLAKSAGNRNIDRITGETHYPHAGKRRGAYPFMGQRTDHLTGAAAHTKIIVYINHIVFHTLTSPNHFFNWRIPGHFTDKAGGFQNSDNFRQGSAVFY
jgi:hypothetical protein